MTYLYLNNSNLYTSTSYKTEYFTGDITPKIVHDSTIVPKKVIVYNTDTIKIDTTKLVNKYKKLLSEYKSKKIYNDTVVNDTSLFLSYNLSISDNKLDSISHIYQNKRGTIVRTITNTIYNKQPKLSLGISIGYQELSPQLTYSITNKLSVYGGYNISQKQPEVGLQLTLLSK